MKIILIGYMGSGKTTIAQLLSEKCALSAFDLDEVIEKKLQMPISEIFKSKGEIFFRKIEHQTFRELLEFPQSMILSLGGGTPSYAGNHELLNGENVTSIYLKASIETLYNRLESSRTARPLIANLNDEELREFIAKHIFDRSFYYNQAKYKVVVDGKSPAAVVSEIEKLLA